MLLPRHALNLFVILVGCYQIGKFGGGAGFGGCDVSCGGQEVRNLNPFSTLSVSWQFEPSTGFNFANGDIPIDQQIGAPSAQYPGGLYESGIIAGHEADGSNLYLCAAFTPGETGLYTPGKFSKALGDCVIAQNGKEVFPTQGYMLLLETYTKPTRVAR